MFVNLPKKEWDTGPAAANAWIRRALAGFDAVDERQQRAKAVIERVGVV